TPCKIPQRACQRSRANPIFSIKDSRRGPMAQPSRPVPSLRPEPRHRSGRRTVLGVRLLTALLWFAALGLAAPGQPAAQVRAEDILNAVVGVRADIPPNARTADSLG